MYIIIYIYIFVDGCIVEVMASFEVDDIGNFEFIFCLGQQEVDMEDGFCYGLVIDLMVIVVVIDDCGIFEFFQDI